MGLKPKEIKDIANKIVNYSLSIGQKPNPHYAKAARRYPWLGGHFTLSQAVKKSGLSEKRVKKILEKYSDPELGPIVIRENSTYHVKDKVGHTVSIVYNTANEELAREIERQCWKNGAHTRTIRLSSGMLEERAKLTPLDSLRELSPVVKAAAEKTDFSIHLDATEREFWTKGIPLQKLQAGAPAKQKLSEVRDRRKTRWLLMGWPHAEQARENGIGKKFYEDVMFASIKYSYDPDMRKTVEQYLQAFKGAKHIKINANDGTLLEFSAKGRHFLKDDGLLTPADIRRNDVGMNIPCGEIFTAPLEDSAMGKIFYPIVCVRGHGIARDVMITFNKGKISNYTATAGKNHLDKFIAENTGEVTRIAEFGIGCNKEAKFTNGSIIVDEKIFGTIHIAIGWNIGYGGKNKASSHLDMIKPLMGCEGQVWADGRLLIDKGVLVAKS
jgi:aminopeptidase